MSAAPPRFIGYCRQSITRGDADDSLSLIGQERAIRQMIAASGGVLLEPMIVDADERGNDPHRPGLKLLMDRAATERPDGIAVYAVSRFARDQWLAEGVWRQLLKTNPALTFRSVTEPHAHDDLVRGILGVISQAERKRMGAFMSAAFAERARQGKHHGPAPYGFTKDDDGRLVVDEDARPIIAQMYRQLEDGWSCRRIALWLRDTVPGVRYWDQNVVRAMLTAPYMGGGVRTKSITTWDAHEGIVSRERWDAAQLLLTKRGTIRTKRLSSWLEGVLYCSCGGRMEFAARTQNGEVIEHLSQFRCTHIAGLEWQAWVPGRAACDAPRKTIIKPKAESLAIAALEADLARVLDWPAARARHEAMQRQRDKASLTERTRLSRHVASLTTQRDRVLDLYRLGKLDVPRWEAEDARLTADLDDAAARLAELDVTDSLDTLHARLDTITTLRDQLPALIATSPEGIRRYLQALGATFVLGVDVLTIEWPAPYGALFATTPYA